MLTATMQQSQIVAGWSPVWQPTPWVVLDIETADAPEEAIEAALQAWSAPSNWKEETVVRKREEAAERIREKSALLDAAPICITGCGVPGGIVLFTSFGYATVQGATVIPGADEWAMLVNLRSWLDAVASPDTEMAGHRVRPWDFPKLRQGYIRHKLRLPAILSQPDMRLFDIERQIQRYSAELQGETFIKLDEVCRVLGLPQAKQHMDGSMVPLLYREGRFQEIATYSAIDIATETRAYTLLAGVASDLE